MIAISFTVIEVSCGEYGDNIKNLVNAIKNGKYDIREGYPFPDNKSEGLNNATSELLQKSEENAEVKDKNDVSNLEEKFQEDKSKEMNNKGILPTYATNDITKQGMQKKANEL